MSRTPERLLGTAGTTILPSRAAGPGSSALTKLVRPRAESGSAAGREWPNSPFDPSTGAA